MLIMGGARSQCIAAAFPESVRVPALNLQAVTWDTHQWRAISLSTSGRARMPQPGLAERAAIGYVYRVTAVELLVLSNGRGRRIG